MTDTQLQLALAKMLPEKLRENHEGTICWRTPINKQVEDTEWLHVCWLVEQTLNQQEAENYEDEIEILVGLDTLKAGFDFAFIHTSWQQRAQALCKVKGVEP